MIDFLVGFMMGMIVMGSIILGMLEYARNRRA
jgi:hypothetical protein